VATATETDVETARDYARAYAAFDEAAVRVMLADSLVFRQVNPGGYLALDSADGYIAATRDFVSSFDSHGAESFGAGPVGDRVATTSRMWLTAGGQRYVMEHQEFVTVREGRVVAIDSVCSGARPDPTA
jgi:hypothetical protein